MFVLFLAFQIHNVDKDCNILKVSYKMNFKTEVQLYLYSYKFQIALVTT